MGTSPERLVWAIELLASRPRDRVLEIGCGNGAAAQLLLAEHPKLELTAIDRSATAIAAARNRLAPFVEAGRVSVVRSELVRFAPPNRFDRAFAVNVNSFWTDPEQARESLARVLVPGGALVLVFEPPSAKQLERIGAACSEQLRDYGLTRISLIRRENRLAVRAFQKR